ncbi:MAG: hypothetical protein JWN83_1877 [Chitinophagaceae bacterium]|nr:hypothetical protein [Chitinophagaceae bacterium]
MNLTSSIINKNFAWYIIKFVFSFCVLYFGTLAVIGLSAPEGKYYSGLIDHHLDYVTWLRLSLMYTTKAVLSIFGHHTYLFFPEILYFKNGGAISIGYDCLGYGISSFWISFVIANNGRWKKKMKWILSGLFILWSINILRLSLLLIAIQNKWVIPFFDHHTWFNIAAYILIFVLIYFYDKSSKTLQTKSGYPKSS